MLWISFITIFLTMAISVITKVLSIMASDIIDHYEYHFHFGVFTNSKKKHENHKITLHSWLRISFITTTSKVNFHHSWLPFDKLTVCELENGEIVEIVDWPYNKKTWWCSKVVCERLPRAKSHSIPFNPSIFPWFSIRSFWFHVTTSRRRLAAVQLRLLGIAPILEVPRRAAERSKVFTKKTDGKPWENGCVEWGWMGLSPLVNVHKQLWNITMLFYG